MTSSKISAAPRGRHRILINLAAPAVFFLAYSHSKNLTTAIECQILVALLAVGFGWVVNRIFEPFPFLLALVSAILTGLAIGLHAPVLIKLENSVPHTVVAIVLLGGLALGRNPLAGLITGFSLPAESWRRIALIIGVFALLIAIANLVIALTLPDRDWVEFKFPIMPLLHLLLVPLLWPAIRAGRRQTA